MQNKNYTSDIYECHERREREREKNPEMPMKCIETTMLPQSRKFFSSIPRSSISSIKDYHTTRTITKTNLLHIFQSRH